MNLALGALFLLSSSSSAEEGPQVAMWAMQQGDGVQITLKLYADGEPGMSDSFDLVRRQGEEETSLLEGRSFQSVEATDIGASCRAKDLEDTGELVNCLQTPQWCVDCDGDGTAECPTDCRDWYQIPVTDGCVPPGETEYGLATAGDLGEGEEARAELVVEDVEQDCMGPVSPVDSGACGGCSQRPIDPQAWLLAAMVLLAGLARRGAGPTGPSQHRRRLRVGAARSPRCSPDKRWG